MRLYLAGPLFIIADRDFNTQLALRLCAAGHEVFLPQEHEFDHHPIWRRAIVPRPAPSWRASAWRILGVGGNLVRRSSSTVSPRRVSETRVRARGAERDVIVTTLAYPMFAFVSRITKSSCHSPRRSHDRHDRNAESGVGSVQG
jgi:hypothetical protein